MEGSSVEEICGRNAIFKQTPEQKPVFMRGFQFPNVCPPPVLYGGFPVLNKFKVAKLWSIVPILRNIPDQVVWLVGDANV